MSATVGRGEAKTTAIEPMALPPLGERPLVSVLVSNFNYAAYLGQAIEGVIGQTYGNLELIVCDDGSTDRSREVLERYARLDARVRPIFQENAGQAAALNAAFQASSGEVISLLDADDVFLPEKLQRVVEAFMSHPGSGFAIHGMRRVDRGRGFLGDIPLLFRMPSGWRGASLPLTVPTMLPGLPPCSGLSLRRAVAERLFPLPTGLRAYADTLIQILAPLITPIVAIEAPLAEYRVHGGNVAGVARFTELHVRRWVSFQNEIWKAWRACLEWNLPGLSANLRLPAEVPVSANAYAHARFRSGTRARHLYRMFIGSPFFESMPRLYRWYWRCTILLPDRLFRSSFDLVYGQTRLKMLLGRTLSTFRRVRGVNTSRE